MERQTFILSIEPGKLPYVLPVTVDYSVNIPWIVNRPPYSCATKTPL